MTLRKEADEAYEKYAQNLVDGDQSLMSKYGFDYAVAFMKAALKLRGWTVAEASEETRRDVDLMVYDRAMTS